MSTSMPGSIAPILAAFFIGSVIVHTSPRLNAGGTYKQVESWSPVPLNADPSWETNGIATNADGTRIYALRRSDPPILEIDPKTGTILKTWGTGLMKWPHSIYLDREGFIWLIDAGIGAAPELHLNPVLESGVKAGKGHQVTKLTPDGKVLLTLGTPGLAGDAPQQFNAPTGVVVASNGDIFVTDGHGGETNARVVKFSKDGKFIKTWGRKGSNPGEFNVPHAISIDS